MKSADVQPSLSAWSCVLLAALALAGVSCKGYTSRQISNPGPAVARLQSGGSLKAEADQLALPLLKRHEIHSMAVGVLKADGGVETFGYGGNPVPGPDTLFEIGSITKVFVASVFVILVDEGKLHYDDTIRSILPPEVKVNQLVGDLTLRELALHTAGLSRQPDTLQQLRYYIDFAFAGRNPYEYIDKPYLYRYLHTLYVEKPEDRRYEYSNIGYGVLAHLIELKTGKSLPELVQEKICGPLNLRDTGFTWTEEQRRRAAPPHVGDAPQFLRRNRAIRDWDMGEIMRASGGMHSTIHDLLIFAQSNLGLSGLALDRQLALTHQIAFHAPEEDISPGWMINHYPEWNSNLMFMNGILSGYSAYLGMDTDKQVAVAVLVSNFNWVDKVGHNLLLRVAASSPVAKTPIPQNY
ncbi:MAG: serine hydrolase domain-containing protein [Verrucomicrobiota bacterium]